MSSHKAWAAAGRQRLKNKQTKSIEGVVTALTPCRECGLLQTTDWKAFREVYKNIALAKNALESCEKIKSYAAQGLHTE